MAGHRRAEATPSFGRLCPAMTEGETEVSPRKKTGAPFSAPDQFTQPISDYADAARGARLRELRWKNSAWLATAETIAGWNGFEIKNAGSGRSPVRKRSG
jgi:hypothetical protein